MLSDFPTKPGQNYGGNAGFKFIPYQYIWSPMTIINKIISVAPVLSPGTAFYNGYSAIDQLLFTETKSSDDQGEIYTYNINGMYPGDLSEVLELFEEMERNRHIVLIKDQNNNLRLVGAGYPLSPLVFNANYSSGSMPGDAKGYSFTFTGTGRRRAPFYNVV